MKAAAKSRIAKYFWDLNEAALSDTARILRDPQNPRFAERLVTLLSRCDRPAELFGIIPRDAFIKTWPQVRARWKKISNESDFRDWWQTIYGQLIQKTASRGKPSALFRRLGISVRQNRIRMGWSQKDLALRVGMKQPDISRVEEGRINITLQTLALLAKALGLKSIEMSD